MFYIVICDDDKGICAQVEDILLDYSRKLCLKLEIDVVYSGESLLTLLKEDSPIDLIFLDIEMGAINGVEVGTHIRTVLRNHRIEIVYVSGRNDYDRQLFDVQPLHFIAKPISASAVIADLKLAMERANRTIEQFVYKKGSEERSFSVCELIYFESIGRTMRIVTTSGEDTFYGSMEDVAIAVSKHQFLQPHRSYLVNYNHIKQLRYTEVVMSNGDVIIISRSKRKEIRNLQI